MLPTISPGGEGGGTGSGGISGGTESSNITGKNLREGGNISLRPKVLTSRHLYNLRNQGWAIPKPTFNGNDSPFDTISQFHNIKSEYPSNADDITPYLYANTASSAGSKTITRFDAVALSSAPSGNTYCPVGYFIIDAIDRGSSRMEQLTQLSQQYTLDHVVAALPSDSTDGGPTVCTEYAGRVWYSGFSGAVIDGDTSSPKMSSYVLFSQLFKEVNSLVACYQEADPTSPDQSDLLDTDGGLIRIEGAYNIIGMVSLGSVLIVLAENGVWTISGGNSYGFTATNYKVTKVTNAGCISAGSIVTVENSLFYFSRDGIYTVAQNQFGDWGADNISKKTIQTYYNSIQSSDISHAEGVYDSYEQKIKWIIGNRFDGLGNVTELNLDTTIGAFYKFTIQKYSNGIYPLLIKGVPTDPFSFTSSQVDVVVGANNVVVSDSQVYVTDLSQQNTTKEVVYLIILGQSPTITYTFGTFRNENHYDWVSLNGVGVDAKSFLLTGVLSGGDFQRRKSLNYLTAHFTKTEDGFMVDPVTEDWIPTNQSACNMQIQWDWTNSVNSGKWTDKRQIYRFRRKYLPATIDDNFDNGYYVVETKNKVRGSGKVLSVLFESVPGKHLTILGWSLVVGVDGNV